MQLEPCSAGMQYGVVLVEDDELVGADGVVVYLHALHAMSARERLVHN